jgi:methanogenic corrinoid protein MtbC1
VVNVTEALNFRDVHSQATLTEKEDSLQQLTNALLTGKSDDTRLRAYAAIAKGNNEREILDAVVEVVNIISDLQEVNQFDQAKMTNLESAVNTCLQVLEEWLTKSERRFGLKVTVGPVGLKTGVLSSLALSASLRAIGFQSTNLGKTQTALDLLRNSEELDADLVIPMLPADGTEHLLAFAEAYERGGFKNKFKVISIAPGTPENLHSDLAIARNDEEAISKATQWALKQPHT